MQTPCWPANSSELGKCPQPKCRLEQAHECLSHTGTSLVLFPAVLPHSPPLVVVRSTVPGKADHRFVGQRSIWRELSCVNDRLRKQPDLPRKLFQAAARARFWMLAFLQVLISGACFPLKRLPQEFGQHIASTAILLGSFRIRRH